MLGIGPYDQLCPKNRWQFFFKKTVAKVFKVTTLQKFDQNPATFLTLEDSAVFSFPQSLGACITVGCKQQILSEL